MKKFITLFAVLLFASAHAQKQIAITIDDLPFVGEMSLKDAQESTEKLLQKIKKHNIRAVGFVNEAMVIKIGETDARTALLEKWLAGGNLLGNHTFSHPSLTTTQLEDYRVELLKGEIITTQLNKKYNQDKKYFRYPFLHVGADSAKRYGFERILKEQGYINAPVTIEADDWYYNKVYRNAKIAGNKELMKSVAQKYIQHNVEYFDYYEKYTQEVVGRPIKHIFLCHANALNTDYFDELCKVMTDRGYTFITIDEAMKDEVYNRPDTVLVKGGFSWLHRWRITDKKKTNLNEVEIQPEIIALYESK